jgi:hypothetical protein
MVEKTLKFHKEKETKNTIRYQETKDEDGRVMIGPLYIQKSFLGEKPPEVVSVNLTFSHARDLAQS